MSSDNLALASSPFRAFRRQSLPACASARTKVNEKTSDTIPTPTGTPTRQLVTFTIDPTKSPKTADSLQTTGADKGKTLLGIYEIIDDNHKRACWAPVGKPRPTAFTSEPGSSRILQVWERIK
jgi:uncharacterized protein (TIGR03067 family)